MNKKLDLDILTPIGKYFSGTIEKMQVHSEDFFIEITPNHSPLISSLVISKMILTIDGKDHIYAIGGGIIEVKDGKVKLLLDSIESKYDIDLDRALRAKKRAEERLLQSDKVDLDRAKNSLRRALNRIEIYHL